MEKFLTTFLTCTLWLEGYDILEYDIFVHDKTTHKNFKYFVYRKVCPTSWGISKEYEFLIDGRRVSWYI